MSKIEKDTTANPAPLGLMAFGMTTILLNLHNAGFFTLGAMILAMGLFYGGLAQVFAGIMEWKKGNTFGMLAFTSYGLFWISLVALMVLPTLGFSNPPESAAIGWYLLLWGVFTAGMFLRTLKINRALQFVFASLTLLFILLALGNFTGNPSVTIIAGYVGIICGLSAMYTAFAILLDEVYGKKKFPVWPVK